jgi:hypothetical protein
MWMMFMRLERHPVDHIHDMDAQFGKMLSKHIDRGERLQRRRVARACHDHVGFTACVVTGRISTCGILDAHMGTSGLIGCGQTS